MFFLFGNKFIFVGMLAIATAVSVWSGFSLVALFASGGSVESTAVAVSVFIPAISFLPSLFRVRHEVMNDNDIRVKEFRNEQ